MKNLILCIILILGSCSNNDNQIDFNGNTSKNQSDNNTIVNNGLEELKLPYCLELDTIRNSDYYETNLDTFLIFHYFKNNNLLKENQYFHKKTVDFISDTEDYFKHYLYKGKAVAIKKLTINKNITAIFYAYLFDSDLIQPRIEIQTFDINYKNIDNLIIASVFTSECSGYRDFCISQEKIITLKDTYGCYDEEDENETELINNYKYKISDEGKFIPIK